MPNLPTKSRQIYQWKLAKFTNASYLGGPKLIDDGVKTLNALANKIDTSKMKEPAFKMVLTGTGDYAYKREDGILVVPIGCLKN